MNQLKKISIFILLILYSIIGYCQFSESKYLYYDLSDDFGSEILLDSTIKTTTIWKDKIVTYYFTKDTLLIQYKNEDGSFVTGQYFITHHIFSNVKRIMDVDTGNFLLCTTKYKFPIKTGKWLFYDEQKNLTKIEIWVNGFLSEP